jgi:hypothetical protein
MITNGKKMGVKRMRVEVKKISRKKNAEFSKSPNQPTHVKNQNDEHNARKVSLGPNTNR